MMTVDVSGVNVHIRRDLDRPVRCRHGSAMGAADDRPGRAEQTVKFGHREGAAVTRITQPLQPVRLGRDQRILGGRGLEAELLTHGIIV
jgi:hypothetical protein